MIPLWDDNSQERTKPVVNYILIAVNLLVFLCQISYDQIAVSIHAFGAVPAFASHGHELYRVVTSIFMHGGWMHLLGNMLFLWVFGDNVEDRLGHDNYFWFYMMSGISATVAQIALAPASFIPLVGASGAIAGVLAAYVIMFPKNSVKTLILGRFIAPVPAYVMIGLWIVIQVVSGSLVASQMGTRGGVAYGAHIGGFLAGAGLAFMMPKAPRPAVVPPPEQKAMAAAVSGPPAPSNPVS